MGAIETEAVVLSVSDYSESSRLLTLLTPGEGRVRLIAKGVRGAKSRSRGSVEPLSHVEARFTLKQPGALGILLEARQLNPAEYLRNDLSKYALAALPVELVDRAAQPGEGSRGLFAALRDFLHDLRDARRPEELTVRVLTRLLIELGFRPEAERCVSCGEAADAQAFSIERGGALCGACRGQAGPVRPFNPGLQRALAILTGGDPAKAARLKLVSGQPRQLLELLLDLAQHHLEVRLNSRIFLQGLWKDQR